jgi:hypothetical protein
MKRWLFFGGVMLLFLASCMRTPEDADLVNHMVVQTEYDTSRIKSGDNIFNTYSTFYLRLDTMGYVFNNPNADTILIDPIKSGTYYFVSPVVDEIASKIESAGFARVEENNDPDFAVKVVVLENFSYFQSISYPFYSGYYGYNGYYYPVVSTYYSNSATLLIEIVDIKNFNENGEKYVVVWRAYIGDLLVTLDLTGRTVDAVDRAFNQSPYISIN